MQLEMLVHPELKLLELNNLLTHKSKNYAAP